MAGRAGWMAAGAVLAVWLSAGQAAAGDDPRRLPAGIGADRDAPAAEYRRVQAAAALAASGLAPVECITAMRPSGEWTAVTCHPGHSAPLPEGAIVHVVHTHPNGTSLSVGDLWVLVARPDIQSVSVVTPDGRIYRTERGPRFAELATVYPRVRARVSFERRRRAEVQGKLPGDLQSDVNAALAERGIVKYAGERVR